MLLTRWSPFAGQSWVRQVQTLQDQMNRLFDRYGDNGEYADEYATYPALNVWEEDDAFELELAVPGFKQEELEIFVTNQNQVTIKGERVEAKPEKAVQHRQERYFGKVMRTMTLPSRVDENKVEARLENGILKLRLPKHEGAKPRKIQVQG